MSSSALPPLRRAYLRLAQSWPSDPLRPELPFADVIRARSEAMFTGVLAAGENGKKVLKEGAHPSAAGAAEGAVKVEEVKITEADRKDAERQLWALRSLMEGRFSLKYPVTQNLTRPRSNPEYYTQLLAEIENAPKRSYLMRKLESWRGWVRWN